MHTDVRQTRPDPRHQTLHERHYTPTIPLLDAPYSPCLIAPSKPGTHLQAYVAPSADSWPVPFPASWSGQVWLFPHLAAPASATMYAPTYGFGQGGSNNAQQQASYNPNAPPAAHPVPQYFQGQQPPPQQQQQQHHQMMYNSQQYGVGGAGAGAGAAGPQQNPYAAMGVNPAMMQGNGGMAHMAVNNGVGTLHRIPGTCSTPT